MNAILAVLVLASCSGPPESGILIDDLKVVPGRMTPGTVRYRGSVPETTFVVADTTGRRIRYKALNKTDEGFEAWLVLVHRGAPQRKFVLVTCNPQRLTILVTAAGRSYLSKDARGAAPVATLSESDYGRALRDLLC